MEKNLSWGVIFVLICLSAVCPFLIIPFVLIYDGISMHRDFFENLYYAVIVIAIVLIMVAAPIITIISICQSGLGATLYDNGMFVGIFIGEIHLALSLVWKCAIRIKLELPGKDPASGYVLMSAHPGVSVIILLVTWYFCLYTFAQEGIIQLVGMLSAIYGTVVVFKRWGMKTIGDHEKIGEHD